MRLSAAREKLWVPRRWVRWWFTPIIPRRFGVVRNARGHTCAHVDVLGKEVQSWRRVRIERPACGHVGV